MDRAEHRNESRSIDRILLSAVGGAFRVAVTSGVAAIFPLFDSLKESQKQDLRRVATVKQAILLDVMHDFSSVSQQISRRTCQPACDNRVV